MPIEYAKESMKIPGWTFGIGDQDVMGIFHVCAKSLHVRHGVPSLVFPSSSVFPPTKALVTMALSALVDFAVFAGILGCGRFVSFSIVGSSHFGSLRPLYPLFYLVDKVSSVEIFARLEAFSVFRAIKRGWFWRLAR